MAWQWQWYCGKSVAVIAADETVSNDFSFTIAVYVRAASIYRQFPHFMVRNALKPHIFGKQFLVIAKKNLSRGFNRKKPQRYRPSRWNGRGAEACGRAPRGNQPIHYISNWRAMIAIQALC